MDSSEFLLLGGQVWPGPAKAEANAQHVPLVNKSVLQPLPVMMIDVVQSRHAMGVA